MKHFLPLLFLALALPLAAQTKPTIDQVRGPALADGRLLAVVNGKLVPVSLGAGVSLVQASGGYELRASAQSGVEARLARAANGAWTIPSGCAISRIFRNGLRQFGAIDYSISGSELRFREGGDAADPSQSDDVVVVECR